MHINCSIQNGRKECNSIPQSIPSIGRHNKIGSAICTASLIGLLLLCLSAIAQDDECYFPGQTYRFNTTYDEDWIYKWTATSGTIDKDDTSEINWTPDLVGVRTNVTLMVTAYNNATLGNLSASCIDADLMNITVCPLATIIIQKDTVPDDPQDFEFVFDDGNNSVPFLLDDDADPALLNNRTFSNLLPGTYIVNETALYCWNLSYIQSSGNATVEIGNGTSYDSSYQAGDSSVRITLEPGDISTCIFTNTKKLANISIIKTANATEPVAPGDLVEYSITVCNTGNTTVDNVVVHDNRTGDVSIGVLNISECKSVNPSYIVSQKDVCNGSVVNYAYASGEDPCNEEAILRTTPVYANITTEYNSSINITKVADTAGPVAPEDEIEYTITVCNTGNLTVRNITVFDSMFGSWQIGDLEKGACNSTTRTHTVTQDDVCHGWINNTASASGLDYCDQLIKTESDAEWDVQTYYNSSLRIIKVADTEGPVASNDEIEYTVTVCNTGNLTVRNITVDDSMFGSWQIGDLVQGACNSTIKTHNVTEDDVCRGWINNTASASGLDYCDQLIETESDAEWNIQAAYNSSISIFKFADTQGPVGPGAKIAYTLEVCNTGDIAVNNVTVHDSLTGDNTSIGTLDSGECDEIIEIYEVTDTDLCNGSITNEAYATGNNYCGIGIETYEKPTITIPTVYNTSISLNKTANRTEATLGDVILYEIVVKNTGNTTIKDLLVTDPSLNLNLPYPGDFLPGENKTISLLYTVMAEDVERGYIENNATAEGQGPCGIVSASDSLRIIINQIQICDLTLIKTADKDAAHLGENITYTITLSSSGECCFTNVTLWDVLPSGVQFVSASPGPSSSSATTLYWDIGRFCGGELKFQVVVRVPITDIQYDMEQGVAGEGFVNVHNDYDTHQGPEAITNCAYAEADLIETLKSCATTKIVDPGTELKRREFGSGTYESEEATSLRTENKSIQSATSLSAVHKPTTFKLPGNSSITYGSKWTEKSKGINAVTGATMNEEYTFANKIEKERVIDLDKNGSTMKTDVAFTGTGHIGVLKKDNPDTHPKIDPTYEASEDYTGSFRVYEMVDEYGNNVRSDKNVTGYGYVAVDKRVSNNQRTYESGTGSYQSEEQIETASNYIAKDISLVHGPTNYSYTPSFATNQNIKWSEGIWSKSGVLAGGVILAALPTSGCGGEAPANTSAPATYISERYSSLNYLNKETVAAGLNAMKTNASFSGMADFRAKAKYGNKTGEIDNEERYVGDYDITRKVQLTGVSKYGRPHITVTKEGNMTTRWFNKTMANVAEYTITIVNDGNVALAPIHIRDIFPPGTEYIYSSIRPDSLSATEANWSLMNLGVGNSIQLELTLNVTEYAPANLVNRVMVCGINSDEGCVSGSAYFVLESGDLSCCPPEVVLDKVAQIDATDQTLIHYTIVVQNNANSTVAATLTDMLPIGMNYMSATNEPDIQSGQFLQWIIPTLEPGDVTTIEYQARATMNGAYVNEVHMDATAVDGTGYDTEDAAARIYIGSTGVPPKTTRYGGWQVPDWNMTSSEQGITVSLSPDEDSAAEFPTMYS